MSTIPCDPLSTIIHPFRMKRRRVYQNFQFDVLACPICTMTKLTTTRNGSHFRSRLLRDGNSPPVITDRHDKLFQLRRNQPR